MKAPNHEHRHSSQIIVQLGVTALPLCVLRAALAYNTGSMSCSDIGDFAAATVAGKQNGGTLKEALAKVNKRTEYHPVGRKNLTQIVRAIYTQPWANKFTEEGARAVAADCEAQQ
jgi:hypothetical protein